MHVLIVHAPRLQLLLVNCARALPWPLGGGGLCARSVTVICVVVSAVSMPDLSEQFTPPETAPPALVSLIYAIEKRGTSLSPAGAFRLPLSAASFPPSASHSHASFGKCSRTAVWFQTGTHAGTSAVVSSFALDLLQL